MLIVSVSLLFGCGGSDDDANDGAANPMQLIPSQSNMIAYIDLAQILDEMDVEGLYEEVPKETDAPGTFEEALDMLGIEELEDAYLFGDISEMMASSEILEGPSGYFGLIVIGSFNQEQLIDAIETQSEEELISSDYKGYTIHAASSGEMALAILNSETLLLGTEECAKDVIDVKEGSQSSVKGEILKTYNDLGSGMVKLAMVMPDDLLDTMNEGMSEDSGMGINPFAIFEDMETVGLVVDKKGDSLPIDVRICFSNKESAENTKGMLAMVMGMMDFDDMEVPEEDKAVVDILKGMEIELDGSCIEIGLEITSEMIEDLAGSFEEGFMEGFGEF